jgi:Polyphosphate kinase middle domain
VLEACRAELRSQQELVARLVEEQLRPALRDMGAPILDIGDLGPSRRDFLALYFVDSVEPVLTPLAADAAHPFPFISNLGLNLAVLVTEPGRRNRRFVRIKVPANRLRWVPLPDHAGWVPLEQVIADNLDALFPRASELACSFFRVTGSGGLAVAAFDLADPGQYVPGQARARARCAHVQGQVGRRDTRQRRDAGPTGQARARLAGRCRSGYQQECERQSNCHCGTCGEPFERWAAPCVRVRSTSPGLVRTRCAAHANGIRDQQVDGRNCQW